MSKFKDKTQSNQNDIIGFFGTTKGIVIGAIIGLSLLVGVVYSVIAY